MGITGADEQFVVQLQFTTANLQKLIK